MSIDISRLSENNEMPEKIFLISSYMRNTSEKIKKYPRKKLFRICGKNVKATIKSMSRKPSILASRRQSPNLSRKPIDIRDSQSTTLTIQQF